MPLVSGGGSLPRAGAVQQVYRRAVVIADGEPPSVGAEVDPEWPRAAGGLRARRQLECRVVEPDLAVIAGRRQTAVWGEGGAIAVPAIVGVASDLRPAGVAVVDAQAIVPPSIAAR